MKRAAKHRAVPGEKRYACPAPGCDATFTYASARKRHQANQHAAHALRCAVCHQPCANGRALHYHTQKHHRGHTCPVCFAPFKHADEANVHRDLHHIRSERQVNTSHPKFTCGCGRVFVNSDHKCNQAPIRRIPDDAAEQEHKADQDYAAFLARFEALATWPHTLPAPGYVRPGTAVSPGAATLDSAALKLELEHGQPIWTYGVLTDVFQPLRDDVWARLWPVHSLESGNVGHDGLPRFSTKYFRRELWKLLFRNLRLRHCTRGGFVGAFFCSLCDNWHENLPVPRLPAPLSPRTVAQPPPSHRTPSPERDVPDVRCGVGAGAGFEAPYSPTQSECDALPDLPPSLL